MNQSPMAVDFNKAPFLVIWETTRSCGLACKHCRAEAILRRDPRELTTEEGKSLMNETARIGTPIFILSGGDPLNREDLEELVAHGRKAGLRVATIPAATNNLTKERIFRLKKAGIDQIAFSLDGPAAELHDTFRGVPGAFAKTLDGVRFVHEAQIPLQINTCFGEWNLKYLDSMISMVQELRVSFWEVFFLIPIGRGSALKGISAEDFERIFERLGRLSAERQFIVKLTEAQHFKRFLLQHRTPGDAFREGASKAAPRNNAVPFGRTRPIGLSPEAVNSGKGFAFIDHVGNICPSGFLPIPAGNVRTDSLEDVYRHSELFCTLRDALLLKGKCGACEFRKICGGSRARAFAMSGGDYLAEDPCCAYQPAASRMRSLQ